MFIYEECYVMFHRLPGFLLIVSFVLATRHDLKLQFDKYSWSTLCLTKPDVKSSKLMHTFF